jgi:FkbM family methyltransferase
MNVREPVRRVVRRLIGERVFGSFRAAYWPVKLLWTQYEPETAALPLLVPRGGVCLDVGANFGQFAVFLSRAVGADGRVHSFEPLAYNRAIFEKVMRRLRRRNVELHPWAVGSEKGVVRIATPDRNTGEAHVAPEGEEAKIVTLDGWAEETSLERVDFVKIDVEGFEMAVLRGAAGVIARFEPVILCEIQELSRSRYGIDPTEPFRFLAERSYRAFRWRPPHLVPCTGPVPGTINYFFVPRSRMTNSSNATAICSAVVAQL